MTKTNILTEKKSHTGYAPLLKLITVAMLSAVSFVLYLFEFTIIPGASHLKLDLSDIPALISGLLFGPLWVVPVELIKNLIELLVKGMGTQMGFGNLMNFIVGCAFSVPFCAVYAKASKKLGSAWSLLISCIVGIISIVGIGIVGNYFIDPPFFKYFLSVELTSQSLWAAIWSATALNAIKGVMLSVVSVPLVLSLAERLKKVLKIS